MMKVSPTSLTTFDTDTAFGCKRRWWFRYVLKLPEAQSDGALLGDKVHKLIEANPKGDEGLYPLIAPAKSWVEEVHAGGWYLEVKLDDPRVLPGASLTGRIDALNPEKRIIRDWKTMKTLQYAKPSMMLERDLQMNLYAAAVAEPGEEIIIEHINIATTKPHQAARTFAVSTAEKRAVVIDKALALVEGMSQYTSISDVNDTEPDRSKCRNCSYKNNCPTGERTVNLLNTILGNKPATLAAPAFSGEKESDRAATAVLDSMKKVAPAGILPPEAPKAEAPFEKVPPPRSTPPLPKKERKLTIQEAPPEVVEAPHKTPAEVTPLVPAPAPVEAPKRGRGRPPGSKNKPAGATLPAGATGTGGIQSIIDNAEASLTVTSITVTRGATVQVVQFEPMRIEVSATADVSGLSLEEAVQELDAQVLAEVIRRMQEMQAAKVGK